VEVAACGSDDDHSTLCHVVAPFLSLLAGSLTLMGA